MTNPSLELVIGEIIPNLKPRKTKDAYIDGVKMYEAFLNQKRRTEEAKAAGKISPRYSNYIGSCFLLIAENLSRLPKFSGYTFKEEMIGDAVENCIMYAHNFDPDKYKNPFAYFTKIVYYAFLRRIMKEKKQTYIKYKSAELYGIFDSLESLDAEGIIKAPFEMYENMSNFIHDFEISKKETKVVKAAKIKTKKYAAVRGVEKFTSIEE